MSGAGSLERAGAVEDVSKMQAVRQSEQFKSILLDTITHDSRTPLTGIKTSVSALLTDSEFDSEEKNKLLTIIDEECDREALICLVSPKIAKPRTFIPVCLFDVNTHYFLDRLWLAIEC